MSVLPADSNAELNTTQITYLCNFLLSVGDSTKTTLVTETGRQRDYLKTLLSEHKLECPSVAMDEQPSIAGDTKGIYLWSPTKGYINKNPEIEDWFLKKLLPMLGTAFPYMFACKYKINAIEQRLAVQKTKTITLTD